MTTTQRTALALACTCFLSFIRCSSNDGEDGDVCTNVRCGRGVCTVGLEEEPVCKCDIGYVADGLICVPSSESRSQCGPCTPPVNADAVCLGDKCDFSCHTGYLRDEETCQPTEETLALPAKEDTYISWLDNNVSFVEVNNMRVQLPRHRSFLEFSLKQIPSSHTVTSATVAIYLEDAAEETSLLEVAAYPTSQSILESAFWTWDTHGIVSGRAFEPRVEKELVDEAGYVEIDVTEIIREWRGFSSTEAVILLLRAGSSLTNLTFASREAGSETAPKLEITIVPRD